MSLMCHEVRTPLNGCLASAEMLLETPLEVRPPQRPRRRFTLQGFVILRLFLRCNLPPAVTSHRTSSWPYFAPAASSCATPSCFVRCNRNLDSTATTSQHTSARYPVSRLQHEQRDLARTIRVSGSILLSTVSNFLDYFKLEAGKALDTVRTPTRLHQVRGRLPFGLRPAPALVGLRLHLGLHW